MPFASDASSRAGVSLAELVVCMGLLGILMVASDNVFRHGLAHQRRLTEIALMEAEALTTIKHVSNTLREINFTRVTLVDDPGPAPCRDALLTPYFRDSDGRVVYTADGNLAWSRAVCFRVEDEGDEAWLVRETGNLAEEYPLPPSLAGLDPPITLTFFTSQTLPRRILNRSIRGFQVDKDADSETLAVRLRVGKTINNRLYEYTVAESFAPRN